MLERLSAAVRQRLEIHGAGLGRILNENEMETRREVLWYGAPAPQTHVVQVGAVANRFSPATLEIRVGDSVRWVNNSGVSHNVAADDGSFRCSNGCDGEGGNGNPAPSWEFTRTFNAEGTIAYHCDVHGLFGMVGQIIVQSP